MKPLQTARGLYDLLQGLEIQILTRDLVYALPLTGYMLAIACLCVWMLPSAWRMRDHSLSRPRKWNVQGMKAMEARLLRAEGDSIWLQSPEAMLNPPRSALSETDRALVAEKGRLAGYTQYPRMFLVLAVLSFAITWTCMLQYFALSLTAYISRHVQSRIAASPLSALTMLAKPKDLHRLPLLWLRDVSLFDEAWSWVCAEPARWLLSSQICVFATAFFTPLIVTSRYERRGQALVTLLLGQIVAISFATGLALRLPHRPAARVSALIWPGLIGATVLSGIMPRVTGTALFLPVLLALHLLLFAPLLPMYRMPRNHLRLGDLFFGVAFLGFLIHLEALLSVQAGGSNYLVIWKGDVPRIWTPETAWKTLIAVKDAFLAHPAQASIGSDALCCAVIFTLSMTPVNRSVHAGGTYQWFVPLALSCLVPFVGLGAIAGVYMALRESEVVEELKSVGEL